MTLEILIEDEYLSVEIKPIGRIYLLCDCCDRYIKKSEMTYEQYLANKEYCPNCLKDSKSISIASWAKGEQNGSK